jgi:hypothetical protein
MNFLPLDDPRWKDLDHRNWRDGKRSDRATDAPFIPDELEKLIEDPTDLERFTRLWPWLCSEGTTWAAAYAAVPYIVSFAKQLRPDQRFEYLCVVGLIVTDACPEEGNSFETKDYLVESYQRALELALPLTTETLLSRHDVTQTRYLLATVAALQGHRRLAKVLQDMDCICGECPKCGECVYPAELQEAIQ